jgi:hypothetical protein
MTAPDQSCNVERIAGMSELDQAAAKSRRTGKPALMRLNPLRNEVLETVH